METSEFIASMRATPGEVALSTEQALARHQAAAGREEPVVSPEERAERHALAMLTAGYAPGQISALSQQAADVAGQLEDERAKLAAGRRRSGQVMRMHAAGQIGALDIPAMIGDSGGDEGRVERLELRLAGLRRQLAEAGEAVSAVAQRARQESGDPVERTQRVAHETFRQLTRQMMADAQAGRLRPERRPFVSRGAAVSAETCPDCAAAGATADEHVKIHEGLDGNAGDAEIDRLLALGYSAETARLAATPAGEVVR